MPFLRRRGNMASESDMRRHTMIGRNSLERHHTSDHSVLGSVPELGPAVGVPAPPATPPDGSRSSCSSRLPYIDRPESPPIQEQTSRHVRFSMLRFRNASDSQLAAKAKQHAAAEKPPPVPRPPEIITTAPTFDMNSQAQKKQQRVKLSGRFRRSGEEPRVGHYDDLDGEEHSNENRRKSMVPEQALPRTHSVTSNKSQRLPPPTSSRANGESNGSTLPFPANTRLSDSSRSDASSAEHRANNSDTSQAGHATYATSLFRTLRRKNKPPEPLFPISHLPQKPKISFTADSTTSNSSLPAASAPDPSAPDGSLLRSASQKTAAPSRPLSGHGANSRNPQSPVQAVFARSSSSPVSALLRPGSRNSGQSSPTKAHLKMRGRSSTASSMGKASPRESVDEHLAPPGLRSSSSIGRKSFGDLFSLSRLRQSSEPHGRGGNLSPATAGSNASKNNSLQIAREPIVLPERKEDDTPAKYLARLEEVLSRSVIAAAVAKSSDSFFLGVLRSYMRRFSFFGDPMDMAIRKLLMEAELPKETQHIDRFLQAFSNRYHECNPGIYASPDQAYFIAFSLLILHTDVFNKNNKRKMQKGDYIKNTQDEGIFNEILEVFYDNITYTPFIHVDDDFDINGDRIAANKAKKKSTILPGGPPDAARRAAREPVDPYTLIIDGNLDVLRPNLKEVMHLDDHYSYLGTAKSLNMKELQKTFFRTGILQIVSARSRPDAFMTEKTATNPDEAHPGIVDIKITKVGLLWRKDVKKKKTRSPWQEWGAILTGAQLYFFRNTTWIKSLMHQYETHIKQGHDGIPVIFKPPLEHFTPDALMSTEGAVALLDFEYKKHKHAFTYVKHGGFEEVLLADDEEELNDWLAKLNYAAAFRTSNVRMRGVVGGSYDGQGRRALRRLDTEIEGIPTPSGEVAVARSKIDQTLAQDILSARREIMRQKISEADEKLRAAQKHLDFQLRNSRHVQILAPIHPKTRENLLLAAARLAAQLKWTRTEIWRLTCHRDILLLDLEEERQLLGLPFEADEPAATAPLEAPAIGRQESRTSDSKTVQGSPRRSPMHLSATRGSAGADTSDIDSSTTDVFETPPTSASMSTFPEQQNKAGTSNAGRAETRKASVSSHMSSNASLSATPTAKRQSMDSVSEKSSAVGGDEVDAGERGLLEQAGLLDVEMPRPTDGKPSTVDAEDGRVRKEHHSSFGHSDRLDRSKIRRSLQRTLREGAGHLSNHRSRRGREAAANAGLVESAQDSAGRLSRGSGSFVVHGKKASVVNFGSELQNLAAPEELFRQRNMSLQAEPLKEDATSSMGSGAASEAGSDLQSILATQSHSAGEQERRESAASASTTTARSLQELRKKYSLAQATKSPPSGAALSALSDTESDVAVDVSGDRPAALAPAPGDPGRTAEEDAGDDNSDDGCGSDEGNERDGEGADSLSVARRRKARETQFFTPEPPASPGPDSLFHHNKKEPHQMNGDERLPSPVIQVVSV